MNLAKPKLGLCISFFLSFLLHVSVLWFQSLVSQAEKTTRDISDSPIVYVSLLSEPVKPQASESQVSEPQAENTVAENATPLAIPAPALVPTHVPEQKPAPVTPPKQPKAPKASKASKKLIPVKTLTNPPPAPTNREPEPEAIPVPTSIPLAAVKLNQNEERLLKKAILSCQKYPESLRRKNQQGSVRLTFQLENPQKLSSWEVLNHEGHSDFIDAAHKTLLCLAAKNILKRNSPKITVNLEFKLR